MSPDPDLALLCSINGPVGSIVTDEWHLSEDFLGDFISFLASSQLPDPVNTFSLVFDEPEILWNHYIQMYLELSSSVSDDKVPAKLTKIFDMLSTCLGDFLRTLSPAS